MITFEFRPLHELIKRYPFLTSESSITEVNPYSYIENLFNSSISLLGNLCLAEINHNERSSDSLSKFFRDFDSLTPEKALNLQEVYFKEFSTIIFTDSQRLKGEEIKNNYLKFLRELISGFYLLSDGGEKKGRLTGDFIRTFVNYLGFLSLHLKGEIISILKKEENFIRVFNFSTSSEEIIKLSNLPDSSLTYFWTRESKTFIPLEPFIIGKTKEKVKNLLLFKSFKDGKSCIYIDWKNGKEIENNNFVSSFGRFFLTHLNIERALHFMKEKNEIINIQILREGLKFIEENKLSEAISSIETFSALYHSFPYLDFLLARAYLSIGATKNALKVALSITSKDRGFSSAFELTGDIYKREGNLSEASRFYQISSRLNLFGKAQEKLRKIQEEIRGKDFQKDEDSAVIEECLVDITSSFTEQYFPIVGRESEIEQIIEILLCKVKNNVLILGDSGVGKTSLVYGLVQRIKSGDVPEKLKGRRVLQVYLSPLIAGAKLRGQFEERMVKLLKRLKDENCVCFIDDIHTVASNFAVKSAGLDVISLLKPSMDKREIQIIATTNFDEYRASLEKETSFIRNFQVIKLDELSVEDTIKVILSRKDSIEEHHDVEICVNDIPKLVENIKIYLRDRFLPDKALDVLDRASSKVYMKFSKGEREDKKVKEQDFAEVISELSKIPISKISASLKDRLSRLEESLKKRVVGQDEAIEILSKAIRTAKLNLDTYIERPDGVFLFIGPTGVGKTELARALADVLFGDEEKLIRLDMSEYMEKFTYSRLVGSPPGYVGYYDQNQLTDLVRQNPYCVILIDEIEKADPQLLNIFLQVFDAGRLTDGRGKTAYFDHATIIMTSNIGTALYSKVNVGYESSGRINRVSRTQLIREIKKYFPPEFLNRLDEIIFFKPLKMEDVKKIVLLQLEDVKKRLQSEGKELVITDSAIETIARSGYSEEYGARNIAREIRRSALDKISELALSEDYSKAKRILINCEKGKIVVSLEEMVDTRVEYNTDFFTKESRH
ncbi:MAG: AAA family ATPase [Candidatus Aminicenantia bacterium]